MEWWVLPRKKAFFVGLTEQRHPATVRRERPCADVGVCPPPVGTLSDGVGVGVLDHLVLVSRPRGEGGGKGGAACRDVPAVGVVPVAQRAPECTSIDQRPHEGAPSLLAQFSVLWVVLLIYFQIVATRRGSRPCGRLCRPTVGQRVPRVSMQEASRQQHHARGDHPKCKNNTLSSLPPPPPPYSQSGGAHDRNAAVEFRLCCGKHSRWMNFHSRLLGSTRCWAGCRGRQTVCRIGCLSRLHGPGLLPLCLQPGLWHGLGQQVVQQVAANPDEPAACNAQAVRIDGVRPCRAAAPHPHRAQGA